MPAAGRPRRRVDGSEKDVFYNEFTRDEVQGGGGLRELGSEHVRPIITRGVLVDIAGLNGVPVLSPAYEVKLADVRGALTRQGMSDESIQPGIGLEVARWIVERRPSRPGR